MLLSLVPSEGGGDVVPGTSPVFYERRVCVCGHRRVFLPFTCREVASWFARSYAPADALATQAQTAKIHSFAEMLDVVLEPTWWALTRDSFPLCRACLLSLRFCIITIPKSRPSLEPMQATFSPCKRLFCPFDVFPNPFLFVPIRLSDQPFILSPWCGSLFSRRLFSLLPVGSIVSWCPRQLREESPFTQSSHGHPDEVFDKIKDTTPLRSCNLAAAFVN